jgi:hypothetical protein
MWRYRIPGEPGNDSGGVVIMDSTGYFSAVTDYGNYAFYWSAHGMDDFRQFVIGLEESWDYVASKLGGLRLTHIFDEEATALDLKRELLEWRRQGGVEKDEAREEWARLEELENGFLTADEWGSLTIFENLSERCHYRVDRDLEAFCKKLMPRLANLLRAELTAEGLSFPKSRRSPTDSQPNKPT